MLANAGGVTVSYFEWVKNINQIRFGRLQRRYEEGRSNALIEALEKQGILPKKPLMHPTAPMRLQKPPVIIWFGLGMKLTGCRWC